MISTLQERVNENFDATILDRVATAKIDELARELARRRMYLECATDHAPRTHCYLGKSECQYQGREVVVNAQTLYQCNKPAIN